MASIESAERERIAAEYWEGLFAPLREELMRLNAVDPVDAAPPEDDWYDEDDVENYHLFDYWHGGEVND